MIALILLQSLHCSNRRGSPIVALTDGAIVAVDVCSRDAGAHCSEANTHSGTGANIRSQPGAAPANERCELLPVGVPVPTIITTAMLRGPAIRDLRVTHDGAWVAITTNAICTSKNAGETWQLRAEIAREDGPWSLQEVGAEHRWLFVQTRTSSSVNAVAEAWVSHPDESWSRLELPRTTQAIRSLDTDGLGRLYAHNSRELFVRELATRRDSGWSEPTQLPGRDALSLHACGRVLLTHSQLDEDGSFWFRSFDRGAHWSPFLLAVLGLDADHALLRCLGARGGIEAGRPPLPSHWSFDGGRTWTHAEYDERARRIAREQGIHAVRCQPGPTGAIECRDDSRTRLVAGSRPNREIYAPAWCESITQLDSRTTASFGARCGLLVSSDHGGLWRPVFAAQNPADSAAPDGQGGLIGDRDAWRLDGGIWWTHDDGAHWTPVASVIGRTLTRGVFIDRERGVFATRNGWVVSTTDSGRTWVYVLRGDIERISSDGPKVFVTTTASVRVSPDGGEHWWSAGVGATGARVTPIVQRLGAGLFVQLADGHRVEQEGEQIRWLRPDQPPMVLLRNLREHVTLAAARVDNHAQVKVLLSDATILRSSPPGDTSSDARTLPASTTGRTQATRRHHRLRRTPRFAH